MQPLSRYNLLKLLQMDNLSLSHEKQSFFDQVAHVVHVAHRDLFFDDSMAIFGDLEE